MEEAPLASTQHPDIVKVSCPSCFSRKTTAFHYSKERREWVYACRETNTTSGLCGLKWVESDRVSLCSTCRYPVDLCIKRDSCEYWCERCNLYVEFDLL